MLKLQHNVMTILYAIRGLSEAHLIRSEEGRFDDPWGRLKHAEQTLRRVYRQASRALEMSRQIGLVAGPAAREKGPEVYGSAACLEECWGEVRERLRAEFSGQLVDLVERIPERFPAIRCTPAELQEIFYQLGKNAFEAMEGKAGKLAVRAELCFSSREEPLAMVSFADSGPGIAEKNLPLIFMLFYTTKPPDRGNGLGLYLARQTARRRGGGLRVSSFPGAGATFVLEFPCV